MSATTAGPFEAVVGRVRWRSLVANGTVMSAATFAILLVVWIAYAPLGFDMFQFNDFVDLTVTLVFAGFGTTLVVIAGGFDLSVAGVISLANVLAATRMGDSTGSVIAVCALVTGIGLLTGLLNGLIVAFLGLESIAVTLAAYIALSGFSLVVLEAPGGAVPERFTVPLTSVLGGQVPVALIAIAVLALLWLLLRRTRYGVALFAVGADEEAARMAGVRTRAVKLVTYSLAGVMYALAGLYYSAETATGDPNSGQPFLLTAFAAAALGGASFAGGKGSVIGTIFGAAVLTVIPKVLFVLGVQSFYTGVVQGIVLIAAVLLAVGTARLARR